MFGRYDLPLKIDLDNLSISIDKERDLFVYKRISADKKVEKTLATDNGHVLINPIEPLKIPKDLTPYLLIEFARPFLMEPNATRTVFLTFPVEIGVYMSSDNEFELLDVFSSVKHKYTLYGDPRRGVLCKYWKCALSPSIPEVDPLREGVLELKITNNASSWTQVTRSVFNALGMKIYFNEKAVSMKAGMKLRPGDMAETDFVNEPIESDMSKSLEVYTARKLSVTSTKFFMEFGL